MATLLWDLLSTSHDFPLSHLAILEFLCHGMSLVLCGAGMQKLVQTPTNFALSQYKKQLETMNLH
jgi:hypothetical protein